MTLRFQAPLLSFYDKIMDWYSNSDLQLCIIYFEDALKQVFQ